MKHLEYFFLNSLFSPVHLYWWVGVKFSRWCIKGKRRQILKYQKNKRLFQLKDIKSGMVIKLVSVLQSLMCIKFNCQERWRTDRQTEAFVQSAHRKQGKLFQKNRAIGRHTMNRKSLAWKTGSLRLGRQFLLHYHRQCKCGQTHQSLTTDAGFWSVSVKTFTTAGSYTLKTYKWE